MKKSTYNKIMDKITARMEGINYYGKYYTIMDGELYCTADSFYSSEKVNYTLVIAK